MTGFASFFMGAVNRQTSIFIANPGQVEYTTPGTYTWTAPAGVYSVCVEIGRAHV